MADDVSSQPPPARDQIQKAINFEVRRFWLEHGNTKIGLEPRTWLLGRSPSCDLVVGDGRASRRHARLLVRANSVTLEDLNSSNGVFVNGRRIIKSVILDDRDEFQIAGATFVLKSEAMPCRNPSSPTPATSPGGSTLAELASQLSIDEAEAITMEAHPLDFLGTLAEKSLALSHADEAERMLSGALEELLKRARAGRAAELPSRVLSKAAHYAVMLADATERGSWIDYAIALYDAADRPLPGTVVDQLYVTVRKVPSFDRSAFTRYVERMRDAPNSGPAARFVIQRLTGLARQLSAK
ncbi:MAG: FHA domain-containing protein [Polyangiaceae bacterium]